MDRQFPYAAWNQMNPQLSQQKSYLYKQRQQNIHRIRTPPPELEYESFNASHGHESTFLKPMDSSQPFHTPQQAYKPMQQATLMMSRPKLRKFLIKPNEESVVLNKYFSHKQFESSNRPKMKLSQSYNLLNEFKQARNESSPEPLPVIRSFSPNIKSQNPYRQPTQVLSSQDYEYGLPTTTKDSLRKMKRINQN